MASVHGLGCLLLAIVSLASATTPASSFPAAPSPFGPRYADAMDSPLKTLVQSLSLPSQPAQTTLQTLQNDQSVTAFVNNNQFVPAQLTAAVCQALKVILGAGQVDNGPVDPALVQENWSQTCWLSPTCIVLPQSSSHVSNTLKLINFFKIKFATRSGGHSPNPGWSALSEPGILIDLQHLDAITVSQDKTVASLGPGGRWGKVYEVLDPYGVSVIGGRIPNVGVGGLILGGGFFHFSGEYGLASDNVKNFEVVLADGSVVNANAGERSDLFWALKGGGPNFGIVTKFDLYTIPVHNIWYQVTIHTVDQVPAILDAFTEWQQNGASDLKSTVALIIGLETVTLGLIYSAPQPQAGVFDPFDGIPAAVTAVPATTGTVLSVTQILGSTFSKIPQRHDYRAASSGIDAQLYKDVHNIWRQQATAVHQATGANQTFVLQPIPAALAAVGLAKGGNPIGVPQKNHQWWTTLIDWEKASDDVKARSASIATTDAWEKLSKERGLDISFRYMNDASRDQNPLATYPQDNIIKLKAISAKYDPSQVFQKLQNSGFLLSRV